MDQIVAQLDERIVILALGIAMLAAWEVGKWMGRRLLNKTDPKPKSEFDDAATAVMSLLLAFAFGVQSVSTTSGGWLSSADSNAIGDFYTCAELLNLLFVSAIITTLLLRPAYHSDNWA